MEVGAYLVVDAEAFELVEAKVRSTTHRVLPGLEPCGVPRWAIFRLRASRMPGRSPGRVRPRATPCTCGAASPAATPWLRDHGRAVLQCLLQHCTIGTLGSPVARSTPPAPDAAAGHPSDATAPPGPRVKCKLSRSLRRTARKPLPWARVGQKCATGRSEFGMETCCSPRASTRIDHGAAAMA